MRDWTKQQRRKFVRKPLSYGLWGLYPTLEVAQEDAQDLRRSGFTARITKEASRSGHRYALWFHRK